MTSRERQTSGRAHLKEKVTKIYENLFSSRDISEGRVQFWDEFFLLRVNMKNFLSHFDQLNFEKLTCLSNQLNQLFLKCVRIIELKKSHIRMANAIQTISCLIEGVFNCVKPRPSPFYSLEDKSTCDSRSLDRSQLVSLMILTGREEPEKVFSDFIQSTTSILTGSHPHRLKCLIIKLYLTITSIHNNIEKNCLLPFLFSDQFYDWLMDSLSSVDSRLTYENDLVNLFTLLLYYHTHETCSPYREKFKLESNQVIFKEYSTFAITELSQFNLHFRKSSIDSQGFLSSLSSIIGSALVGGEKPVEFVKIPECSLFSLYVGIYCNENLLLHLMDTTPYPGTPGATPDINTADKSISLSDNSVDEISEVKILKHSSSLSSNGDSDPNTNLMVLLLEYASIVMQDSKDPAKQDACRLCFIIFLITCESNAANFILHDSQMNFKVNLHKMPMRHRKLDKKPPIKSKPLACSLLDLMVEYICCHLMNPLPFESYSVCLRIIQRLVCYQKKMKLRIDFEWKQIWSALFNLMKYLISIANHLSKPSADIFDLLDETVKIFNLFITYGDSFLPSTSTYDDLYYELIRMCVVFENTYTLILRYTASSESEIKSRTLRLSSQLDNIRFIIGHFTPKIESWATQQRQTSLSQEEVMNIIKANYETLTLKLLPGLDQSMNFNENGEHERIFFCHLLESIMVTIRNDTLDTNLLQQHYFHELSLVTTGQESSS